jgi:LuxR family maltose regulon positive regulatory protein
LQQLTFLLDQLPATLQLVLLTRSDPPLPLARLRAQHDLNEPRADDLRVSLAETQAFLRQAIPYPLPDDAIRRLAARTEGWVAGLRLIALALERHQDPQAVARMLTTIGQPPTYRSLPGRRGSARPARADPDLSAAHEK